MKTERDIKRLKRWFENLSESDKELIRRFTIRLYSLNEEAKEDLK